MATFSREILNDTMINDPKLKSIMTNAIKCRIGFIHIVSPSSSSSPSLISQPRPWVWGNLSQRTATSCHKLTHSSSSTSFSSFCLSFILTFSFSVFLSRFLSCFHSCFLTSSLSFLDAFLQLYKGMFPPVDPLIGPSVRPSSMC